MNTMIDYNNKGMKGGIKNFKMRKILDNNKRGGTKLITTVFVAMFLVVAFGVIYFVYSDTQQTALDKQLQVDLLTSPSSSLIGKPATMSIFALDAGNTDTTTKVVGDLYVITDPVIGADVISGGFAVDGTALSASARTAVTTGITVGTNVAAIASNDTYFGFPTEMMIIGTAKSGDNYALAGLGQSQTLDLDVYKTAPALSIRVYEDNTEVTEEGNRNLSVGASQTMVPDEIRFEMNLTNVAVNLAGFYIDLPSGSNVTSVEIASEAGVGLTESNVNLKYTEADDYFFTFSSPILMEAWDKVILENAIKLTGTSSGCSTGDNLDTVTIGAVDKIWVKSSDSSSMIYAYESDAASPTDIGLANTDLVLNCGANA